MSLTHNKIVTLVYKFKTKLDLGDSQLSWFTAKLTALMAVSYLLDKLGIPLTRTQLICIVPIAIVCLFLLGLFWKQIGFYDAERFASAELDPVQKEILAAARIINNRKG